MMKQKEYEHCYKARYKRPCTAGSWLMMFKAWRYEFQSRFGIVKHRHRRTWAGRDRFRIWGHESIKTVLYGRPAKPIGRKKHGKWLYMPKRILLGGNN